MGVGKMFIENPNWKDMQTEYSSYQLHKVQYMILNSDELDEHTSSYDPIWYLYHSMMSLQQYLWQDCNDYDEIAPEDLDDNLNAYEPFLKGDYEDNPDLLLQYGPSSSDMGLDAPLYFADTLADAEWSFVHQQDLTVRKMYHLHRWNVVYDLGDGSGYFSDSKMKGYCAGKLNANWFMMDEHGEKEKSLVHFAVEHVVD